MPRSPVVAQQGQEGAYGPDEGRLRGVAAGAPGGDRYEGAQDAVGHVVRRDLPLIRMSKGRYMAP